MENIIPLSTICSYQTINCVFGSETFINTRVREPTLVLIVSKRSAHMNINPSDLIARAWDPHAEHERAISAHWSTHFVYLPCT
jgi:hypothetical protein